MNDKPVIIAGLIIFLVAATFPIWYTFAAGDAGPRQAVELPEGEGKDKCVEDRAYMIGNHMKLLYDWRNAVVRDAKKTPYTSKASGEKHEMSLTKTCLKCHTDRDKFCNRCHDYADVKPNCWTCHVDLKEK